MQVGCWYILWDPSLVPTCLRYPVVLLAAKLLVAKPSKMHAMLFDCPVRHTVSEPTSASTDLRLAGYRRADLCWCLLLLLLCRQLLLQVLYLAPQLLQRLVCCCH